jgi:3-oxoacyl-[acyl-carrier protein] reductase
MTPPAAAAPRRALVLGGSGAVGGAIVEALAARGVDVVFTFHAGRERALALSRAHGAHAVAVDLARPEAVRGLVGGLEAEGHAPDILMHAAAVTRGRKLGDLSDDDWAAMVAVNVTSAVVAAQALAPGLAARGGGDLVFLGGIDRAQVVTAPVGYAATQGALAAMTMALAKELGASGVRANMIALGILDQGLSGGMDETLLADYRRFSALRRTGTPAEVARAAVWLALDNRYMTGRVIPVNGGL